METAKQITTSGILEVSNQASLVAQTLADAYHANVHFSKANKSEYISYVEGNQTSGPLTPDQTLSL
jgi:hypothetical protein